MIFDLPNQEIQKMMRGEKRLVVINNDLLPYKLVCMNFEQYKDLLREKIRLEREIERLREQLE
ncbi:MAG: hypothetical protein ACOCQR_00815 [bacterium]